MGVSLSYQFEVIKGIAGNESTDHFLTSGGLVSPAPSGLPLWQEHPKQKQPFLLLIRIGFHEIMVLLKDFQPPGKEWNR